MSHPNPGIHGIHRHPRTTYSFHCDAAHGERVHAAVAGQMDGLAAHAKPRSEAKQHLTERHRCGGM